ncbi:hypothetical protein GTP56_05990 [Duganella sp. FT134W]|uniref:TnsA endonuclease N-terminal domain-containing protein n=1 Tax=Duganella margarita TaxID=2692170 RepID=A0A7X4GY39_9BURK|nr:hypothetical protein [Duganella margarita]MYM71748.1 hypothetical protein [Duganella margarita]
MSSAAPTLKSQQRQNVLLKYRGRGHRNNQLWLLYSYKTRRDWIINSDHELVYWLTYLESHGDVKSFDLAPETLPFEAHKALKFFQVELRNGTIQWHVIHSSSSETTNTTERSIPQHEAIVVWDHATIRLKAPLAVRWLKPIAFVAAIRDQSLTPVHLALIDVVKEIKSGTVLDVIKMMQGFDLPLVYGVFVRLCILGYIEIDLSVKPFSSISEWRYINEASYVVP